MIEPTSHPPVQSSRQIALLGLAIWLAIGLASGAAGDDSSVSGTFTVNGEKVELPHAYAWPAEEGFYDEADPTWTLLFVDRALEPRDLGGMVWDAAFLKVGITETAEFDDEPKLQAYSQSIRFSADHPGNVSGGTYPEVEFTVEADRVKGRVYQAEEQEFFDDTYQYDFTFDLPLSDPNAPIGDPLPADGGAPGKAYLAWIEAVHSGDLARLKAIVPAEMAAQFDEASEEEVQEQLEFMQIMTPKEVEIVGGSMEGDTAILKATVTMDGETGDAEITMTKMGEFWIPTEVSM